uniref:Global nitrogen transcriptional regulator n=1 Tax=Erythroglossum lusitanicum TaxID=2575615 RepID=A0A4D6WSE8_9FLOR|nr:global nitrogen transcriptional regulator [Erythroglossum lusitanicum]
MQWINAFSNSQIKYYIYKLNKGDSIIYNYYETYNKSLIILSGIIYIIKIFTNREIIPIAILNTNNIICLDNLYTTKQNYYKLTAFEQTYIISFNMNELKYESHICKSLTSNIIKSYDLTLKKYELMNNILMQKNIQNRLIQIILFLSLEFGIVYQQKIIIPFTLSQKNLANITGSNKITINRIIHKLSKQMIIKYSLKKKFIFRIFLL